MQLQTCRVEDRPLQRQRQRGTGGNSQPRVRGNGRGLMPGAPERRHRRQGDVRGRRRRATHRLRQGRIREDERNAMQQQRRDKIRETVRMRQRNDTEIGPVRPQSHGEDNVVRVSHQLLRTKRDHARRAGGRRSRLEVNTTGRQPAELPRRLARFQRTDRLPCPPGAEHCEDELCANAARINDGIRCGRGLSRGSVELAERPLLATGGVAQREIVAILFHDLAPAFVKHCQLGNAAIASAASANEPKKSSRTARDRKDRKERTA